MGSRVFIQYSLGLMTLVTKEIAGNEKICNENSVIGGTLDEVALLGSQNEKKKKKSGENLRAF